MLALGTVKHGNKAWIELGPLQFQPSEFAKVAVILALAAYLVGHPWSVRSWKGLFSGPYLWLGITVILVILQQDLGTTIVLTLSSLVFMGIAGTRFRFWGAPLLVMIALGGILIVPHMGGHRVDRFKAWLNPSDKTIQASYQPYNSLIAVGSGGLLGRGFCMSRQKWFYLPGAHNDYIMAIIAEELGLVFTVLFLFVPYLFMIFRGFTIGHRAPDEFSALVAIGCTVMLATQALVNMSVTLNLLPCTGIPLPFISYGGTSLIASMMMAGLILNVSGMQPGPRLRRPGEVMAPTGGGATVPLTAGR